MPTENIRSDNRDGHLVCQGVSTDYVTTQEYANGAISHAGDIGVGQQYPFASIYYLVSRVVFFF